MFNPEGVKGKTAQPPHKIFNFMTKQIFYIDLNVKDVNTQIELPQYLWVGVSNSALRAERLAKAAYKRMAYRRWFFRTKGQYGLTAKQLQALIDDKLITPPDLVEVTVAKIESEPYCPPQRGDVEDARAFMDYAYMNGL